MMQEPKSGADLEKHNNELGLTVQRYEGENRRLTAEKARAIEKLEDMQKALKKKNLEIENLTDENMALRRGLAANATNYAFFVTTLANLGNDVASMKVSVKAKAELMAKFGRLSDTLSNSWKQIDELIKSRRQDDKKE